MNFGNTIAQLRAKAGLSQQDVADYLGITRVTYAAIETSKREPKLDEIRALGEFYQIDTISLIDGTNQINAPSVADASAMDKITPRADVTLHPEKLRQVLLYISEKVGAKPNVGATVINKLLYFIDFDYYEKYGESITGLNYIRNHYGPTAHLPTVSTIIDGMQRDGDLEVVETEYFKHKQKKYLPRNSADLTKLGARELAHIDEELERLSSKSASELSEMSHQDMPWLATKPGEVIDYQLAMYRTAATSVRSSDDVAL